MTAQRPAIGSRKFLKIVFLSLDWNEIKQKLKLKTSGASLRVIFRVEGKPCKKVASEELGFVRQLHARRHFHHLKPAIFNVNVIVVVVIRLSIALGEVLQRIGVEKIKCCMMGRKKNGRKFKLTKD